MATRAIVALMITYCSLLTIPAHAVVGVLDTEDRFPFVVQLNAEAQDGARWKCSGAVSFTGLVSTAAHCVWDPAHHGLVKNIDTIYKDADGLIHTVHSHKIFYPKEFEVAYSRWFNSRNVAPPDVVSLNFNLMSVQDIAFIVPADFIEVEGHAHWGTELLDAPPCWTSMEDIKKYDAGVPPEHCRGKFSAAKMSEQLGDYAGLRAMAVGYGMYFCNKYDANEETPKNCKSDGNRRYVELPLLDHVEVHGQIFRPPELWCTGQNEFGINPVQHGDSGGPRFIRAKDGRWLFVGYTSGGSNVEECASSIFMHLDLWQQAAIYHFRLQYNNGFKGAESFTTHQLRRYLDEFLDNWSASNDETIRGQKRFFDDGHNSYLHSPAYNYKEALQFAEKWPKRDFHLEPGSTPTVIGGDDGDDEIKADIEWRLENPATNETAEGIVTLDLLVREGFTNEMQVAYGEAGSWPYFESWKCLIKSGGSEIAGWDCHKPLPPHWTHNGSVVRLNAIGTKREFYYEAPRQELERIGVRRGTLLFTGRRSGNSYSGTAYIFNKHCGAIAYAVAGEVASDDRSVTMQGEAPRVDTKCNVVGTRSDILTFTYVDDE